jgi:hypothetical protein
MAATGFSESLFITTTAADSLSLLNLQKYHSGVIDNPKTGCSRIIFQLNFIIYLSRNGVDVESVLET